MASIVCALALLSLSSCANDADASSDSTAAADTQAETINDTQTNSDATQASVGGSMTCRREGEKTNFTFKITSLWPVTDLENELPNGAHIRGPRAVVRISNKDADSFFTLHIYFKRNTDSDVPFSILMDSNDIRWISTPQWHLHAAELKAGSGTALLRGGKAAAGSKEYVATAINIPAGAEMDVKSCSGVGGTIELAFKEIWLSELQPRLFPTVQRWICSGTFVSTVVSVKDAPWCAKP